MALASLAAKFQDTTGGVKTISFSDKVNMPSVTLTSGSMGSLSFGSSNLLTIACDEYHSDASWEMKDKDGVNSVETKIECIAVAMATATLTWLRTVAASSGIVCAVEYYNGEKLFFGWDNKVGTDGFLRLSSCKATAGKSPEDMVKVDFTLTGKQKEVPYVYTAVS